MIRLALRVAGLAGIYLLALTSLHPGDVLVGALLASAVVAGTERLRSSIGHPAAPAAGLGSRLVGVPALVGGTLSDVARGTFDTARVCLTGRAPGPGIVSVPIPPGTSTAAWTVRVGLGPDSVVIDTDAHKGEMLLHVLDARDPDAVRTAHEDSYRRRQRGVLP